MFSLPAQPLASVLLSWRNAPGECTRCLFFWTAKITFPTCLPLWHQKEISAAVLQDNCVCSRKRALGGWRVGSCKPARSAVMVFVLAWLPLALDTDLYYPAGSRFITAPLLSSENFFFAPHAYYPRLPKESSRAEPF